MDLSLNETQLMLQSMAREFAEREAPKKTVREIDESGAGFSADLWAKITELGWQGMAVPEELGGTGNSLTDLAAVFEVLGQNATPSPLLSQVLCGFVVQAVATPDQQRALLPTIAAGERLAAFSLTERDCGWGPDFVGVRAAIGFGKATLNGTKTLVPFAHVCDDLYVVARSSAGLTLVRVDGSASGMSVRQQRGWLGEPLCEVTFEGVEGDVIGEDGAAWPGIEWALERAAVLLSAYMLGGAQASLDMAIEYSKTRIAFGQAIGTFQRVQDHIVQALNDTDSIRWTTYEALWKLDEGREDASVAASMAKAVANESFQSAAEHSLYVHAGAGMDLDYGLTNHIKRSKFYSHYLGDATHHKLRMARILQLTPEVMA